VGPAPRLVSILIAAREPGAAVAAKVGELLGTVSLACEVVVVLDGPDPAALAALAELADDRITVRALERSQGKAAALNCAVALARGDVLVFTDVRQRVAEGAVEHLLAHLASPDVGVVSGSLTISSSGGSAGVYDRYWRFERQLRREDREIGRIDGVDGLDGVGFGRAGILKVFDRPLERDARTFRRERDVLHLDAGG